MRSHNKEKQGCLDFLHSCLVKATILTLITAFTLMALALYQRPGSTAYPETQKGPRSAPANLAAELEPMILRNLAKSLDRHKSELSIGMFSTSYFYDKRAQLNYVGTIYYPSERGTQINEKFVAIFEKQEGAWVLLEILFAENRGFRYAMSLVDQETAEFAKELIKKEEEAKEKKDKAPQDSEEFQDPEEPGK